MIRVISNLYCTILKLLLVDFFFFFCSFLTFLVFFSSILALNIAGLGPEIQISRYHNTTALRPADHVILWGRSLIRSNLDQSRADPRSFPTTTWSDHICTKTSVS